MTVFTELRKRQILQDKVHGTLAEKGVFTSYCIDKLKYEDVILLAELLSTLQMFLHHLTNPRIIHFTA